MVTIKSYRLNEGEKGSFISLECTGGVEMVQSQETGKFYATVRRCFIPATFDEETARNMVGSQMPGNIERVQCDEYDYTIKDTGEVIKLAYRYDYVPEIRTVIKKPQIVA